jgi:PLP dependent protein
MSERSTRLADNLRAVRERVAHACRRSGRPESSVRLVAVTKSVDIETARELVELGQKDLGENRVQELLRKDEGLRGMGVNWHLIGHLQTNKVKKALEASRFIHSVDSLRLAEELSRRAGELDLTPEILLEVNVSGEESKEGLTVAETPGIAESAGKLANLRLVGLMTMAPVVENPEETRGVFAGLRELGERIDGMRLAGVEMRELSMGMTQDFEVAIEEGATLVRVGSALFQGVTS